MSDGPGKADGWEALRARLDEIRQVGQYRSIESAAAVPGLANFCANDYLGLSRDPEVMAAAADAAGKYGAGATASRVLGGTTPLHDALEAALAEFKGAESALLFSSGYLACMGVVGALARRTDGPDVPVLLDRLCHASLIDGALLNGRQWRRFAHNDAEDLERHLVKLKADGGGAPTALVVTEGLFSMDGDYAPLRAMADACERHGAWLVVDDAHGTGTSGPGGRGSVARAGLSGSAPIVQIGTLSKALGSQGGFFCGPAVVRDFLVNTARPFIYDTALNPPAVGAALKALELLMAQPTMVDELRERRRILDEALDGIPLVASGESPILPVILKEEDAAVAARAALQGKGYQVSAVRPPTVAPGSSRLRITLSRAQSIEQVQGLAKVLREILPS